MGIINFVPYFVAVSAYFIGSAPAILRKRQSVTLLCGLLLPIYNKKWNLKNCRRPWCSIVHSPKLKINQYYLHLWCFSFAASNREIWDHTQQDAPVSSSVLPPTGKMTPERVYSTNSSMSKKMKVSVTANPYTVASLQVATNSFCQDSLLGEGSLGRVYKADFPNGKVKHHLQ